ncbi:MAG: hypothetical protein IKE61_01295 [Coriobacteriales bacterium]|nr:hypothetical protein [Coriobacteriales bacterium]
MNDLENTNAIEELEAVAEAAETDAYRPLHQRFPEMAEPVDEVEAEVDAEVEAEPEAEAEVEAELDDEVETEPESEVEAEAETEVEVDPEVEVEQDEELELVPPPEPSDEELTIAADEDSLAIVAKEPADVALAGTPSAIVAAEKPGKLTAFEDDDEPDEDFPFRKRTDARCTFLLGLWSIILCCTIVGSPFAVILSLAGKRLMKYSDEDYNLTRNGRVGSKLCSIGVVLGTIIFVIAVGVCAFVWFKLMF